MVGANTGVRPVFTIANMVIIMGNMVSTIVNMISAIGNPVIIMGEMVVIGRTRGFAPTAIHLMSPCPHEATLW
jgi:hypothetical protein